MFKKLIGLLAVIVLLSWFPQAEAETSILFYQPSSGVPVAAPVDGSNQLLINCAVGCSASAGPSFGSAFPAQGIAIGAKLGANLSWLTLDGSNNLNINCTVGCSGGTASNAGSGVATSSTNGTSNTWNYLFNGTTWDQWKGDTTNGAFVNVKTSVLPTLAATSTKQSDGSQKTQIVDGSGNVIASTSNNLNVQCANCSGSGVSAADEASFTAGTSLFAPSGGFYQTTATSNALTNGQQGFFQVTANRALFSNLRNAAGTEVGTATTPVQVGLQAQTSGGYSIASAVVPANTTAVVVKASAGQVGKIEAFNNSAVVAYVKLYNATSATCGSGTPVARYMIPASTSGAGLATEVTIGDAYTTGITYCLTTGIADSDNTAPTASTYLVNVHYK